MFIFEGGSKFMSDQKLKSFQNQKQFSTMLFILDFKEIPSGPT